MADNPQPPVELIEHLNRRDCVLFVGDALDGVSQSAQLASALVDACGAHLACPVPSCRPGRCIQPDTCAISLPRAAQIYESSTSRQSLMDFVIRRMNSTGQPGPLHHALAALPVCVIITTAYDDRMEVALRAAGRPHLSVARDTDVPFDDPDCVQIIRLHGTVSQPESLVLTQNDMADLFARLSPVTRIIVQAHLASKTLLFVGYRLDDYFRQLYRQVTVPLDRSRRPAYAVQWPPDELEMISWKDQITFCHAEPLPFLDELVRSTHVQTVKHAPVPLPSEPYKFLDYYTREDAAIFFGRGLEADLLLSTVLAHKLTVLYGRSGTGKTSLLLARVTPALEQAGYRVAYARMLGDPATEVQSAVWRALIGQPTCADTNRSLCDVLAKALSLNARLVVVLDQFEEFFIRQGEAVRRAFAQQMADCLAREDLDLRFVLSQRDDYLGTLDEMASILPGDVFAHRFRLETLTRDKALLAIRKPAEAFGLPVEEALCEQLIADLEDQGLEPANLQIVLYHLYRDAVEQGLWHEADKRGIGLTMARYEALGGTRNILVSYLDRVVDELETDQERRAAQAVLKSMVTAERTKTAVSGQEIAHGNLVAKVGLAEAELDAMLAYLRQKRVVRKFGDEDRYELSHEVMVERVWAWVSDEELRVLNVRDMLRRAMGDWQAFKHLLAPDKLELVESCCEALALEADELELLFRSALAVAAKVSFWFERACQGGVAADAIALEGLKSNSFRTRAAAVAALTQLGEEYVKALIPLLADDYPQVRAAAIHGLEWLRPDGGWRAHLKYECYVPAGEFVMGDDGSGPGDAKPAHTVYLNAFYIARYPVTKADYKRYMDDLGRVFELPSDKANHPVVKISWYDAHDYAAWAGMRLLTEAEWEKAASWEQGNKEQGIRGKKRVYPWGDEFDEKRCNTKEAGVGATTSVGEFSPQGDSPYGCADMAGNIWEWTSTLYGNYRYPYKPDDGRENSSSTNPRVRRGGSFFDTSLEASCTFRKKLDPVSRGRRYGFRVGFSFSDAAPQAAEASSRCEDIEQASEGK